MSDMQTPDEGPVLQIDIVSDVVCPWCIIGFRQLEKALRITATSASIRWHPFELNPHMAEEGENLREHLAAKYGTAPEESRKARDRLTAIGEEVGFTFNYADDMRMVNTFRAHQLIRWAGRQGKEHHAEMALFEAFFARRENLNDLQVLADAAGSLGLDRAEALAVLEDGRFADEVRKEEAFWTSNGIQGVPAVIFDRQHLVTGAQGTDNYVAILRQLASGKAA
ncbi:DsbA family protein [Roseibium sp. RKSG952]|uniref:DsbA family oxidoreductase n=1 Tax=Roseibium sp. RKSG952 TaxID=2529384 RepID=UPI0012BCDFC1|nr:DsbA family oxidoreductase [Roseibium sp. RKSG952]MTH98808.1 DsbA family oxidoreductase [Roseibium sp. RKSG952]